MSEGRSTCAVPCERVSSVVCTVQTRCSPTCRRRERSTATWRWRSATTTTAATTTQRLQQGCITSTTSVRRTVTVAVGRHPRLLHFHRCLPVNFSTRSRHPRSVAFPFYREKRFYNAMESKNSHYILFSFFLVCLILSLRSCSLNLTKWEVQLCLNLSHGLVSK